MRRILLVAALLAMPAASAQAVFSMGEFTIEDARLPPPMQPQSPGMLRLDLAYQCAHTDAGLDDLVVHINATAQRRSDGVAILLDDVPPQVLKLDDCPRSGFDDLGEQVDILWTMPAFEEQDVMQIDVTVWAERGEGATYGRSDDITASYSVPMVLPEEDVQNATLEQTASSEHYGQDDQMAPGPALPLLAGGLALLARRRR